MNKMMTPPAIDRSALEAFKKWTIAHWAHWDLRSIATNGGFSRFIDPDTDNAWLGFEAAWKLRAADALLTTEQSLAADILSELINARAKWPGKNVTFAALVEEVGELATATFEESRARVREEAIQVAVMAMRMVLDGDHTFNEWRQGRGLDALTDQVEGAAE